VTPLPPEPTARYGSYAAARESLEVLLRRTLGAWADSATWTRQDEPFYYRDSVTLVKTTRGTYFWARDERSVPVLVPCLHMTVENDVEGAPGSSEIEKALEAAGWVRDDVYDADGPDGTHFVLVCLEALCDVDASWDGGDDSDSTYVSAPGERVELRCVPPPAPTRLPGRDR
jgi:hypothetical protein